MMDVLPLPGARERHPLKGYVAWITHSLLRDLTGLAIAAFIA